ncbi:MAG TPA: efflux RND transporter periplasmic adaptor subunit [Rhizomicrobium sp.]|jgi:RND family efflux transporter MFP subunit|nr:efflux RND transporter periplasmic adaptor subunit [Rhizomicrobium sp.]
MDDTHQGGFRGWAIVLLIAAAILVAAVIVLHSRHLSAQRSGLDRDAAAGPAVQAVRAVAGPALQTVTVLASVTPYQQATLYAKVSGYLSKVLVDKGDVVKTGQLLATIESEETDAQYNSARADLLNKQQIARRYDQLLRQNAIAAQQADQADADARVAKATLDQYATLKSYERLVAPFDGRVTARFADPGALVQNATTSQTAAQPVVTVSDDTRLRIDAYVQQDVAPFVHVGDTADIVDAANSGRSIEAKITRLSGQLDPRTRTMLVEVVLDNSKDFLLGGSFVYMTLHVPMARATQVPVGALITNGDNQFVAEIGPDSRLHYVKIAVRSTDGDTVTLAGGVAPGTRIGVDLPAEAADGSLVRPILSSSPQ